MIRKSISALTAIALVAVVLLAETQITTATTAKTAVTATRHRTCNKKFTAKQAKRAADVVYGGHRKVTLRGVRSLRRIEHCQRNPQAKKFVDWYYQQARKRHVQNVYDHNHPWNNDGWFTEYFPGGGGDNGGTDYACGGSYVYGDMVVANSQLPCGTKVELQENGRTADVVVEDRFGGSHPVGNFDLTPAVADQLGCTCSEPGSWRLR